jgi:ADP-heptose:LPS heptosyltransferase
VEASSGAARVAPSTTLRELIAYLKQARLFVGGDTGPFHIAGAFGVPVVGLFGPSDPIMNGPFGNDDAVVWKSVPCSPCYKRRCPGYGTVCMTSIEVDEVLDVVRTRLALKK